MHIVATNICVWIRTVFKEGIKDIAAFRVARGEGVSEDFMIKGRDSHLGNAKNKCIVAIVTGAKLLQWATMFTAR